MAASLQKERDAISAKAVITEEENKTLSARVAELTQQLNSASRQIKSMSKGDGSPKQDSASKAKGSPKSETPDSHQEKQDGGNAEQTLDGRVIDAPVIIGFLSCCMAHCLRATVSIGLVP